MVENYEPPVENADPQYSVGSGSAEAPAPVRPPVPDGAWVYPGVDVAEPDSSPAPQDPEEADPPTEEQAQ